MQIDDKLTDEAVLGELGTRLERTRLERNLSQRQLGAEAGVERKAVQRLEGGEEVKLTTLIRVLRALGLLDAIDHLVPEPQASPIQLLELRGRSRRRATGVRRTRAEGDTVDREDSPAWRWGDERPPSQA
jgi:transcriptional regulator with XRE-family HTH domain